MKVIKRIRRETPVQKLKQFFAEMGIISKLILAAYSVVALVLFFISEPPKYSFRTLFLMRISEILLFIALGISDLKRQEEKGSFFLIITFLVKILLLTHKIISVFVEGWPQFGLLCMTAIPIQYLFMIMIEDGFDKPENQKYLFIDAFQIKYRFYPLFVFILLMITAIRVDLLIPFALGIIFHFGKVNAFAQYLSNRLNEKVLTERMVGLGFIKHGKAEKKSRPIDELVTNDSIFLDEK